MTDLDLVLLLEDEGIIAIDVEDMLVTAGARRVVWLDSCEAAMEWLSENTPDLAFIDPRLKDGSCAEVARHLVESDIPFVVYSGDVRSAVEAEAAFGQGVALIKPSRPADVSGAVAAAITARGSDKERSMG